MNTAALGTQPAAVNDQMAFRNVMGHFPTGVVLITGIAQDGEPVGMIVGSFTSVSLDPPLVGFLPTVASSTFKKLRTASSFCVNVLAAGQEELCRRFAGRSSDKFDNVKWSPAPSGAPVLDGAVAYIDCTFESVTDAGDHYIVVGAVQELQVCTPVTPLLFFQGGYGRFAPLSLHAPFEPDLIRAVRRAERHDEKIRQLATLLSADISTMAVIGDEMAVIVSGTGEFDDGTRLGERIPLMPPMGEMFLAWEDEENIERWLARALPSDQCTSENYRARLQVARERGWSVTMCGNFPDNEVYSALREYSSGLYTPVQERSLREIIAQTSSSYEPVRFDADGSYDVDSLLAPVRDLSGKVHLVLRASALPRGASGSQVTAWAQELVRIAEEMSGA